MNNNLELENEDPIDNEVSPRTNYGEGWGNEDPIDNQIRIDAELLHPNDGYNEEMYCDIGAYERAMFIAGALHQSKKMYSEYDLLLAFEAGMEFIGEDKDSFQEFLSKLKRNKGML